MPRASAAAAASALAWQAGALAWQSPLLHRTRRRALLQRPLDTNVDEALSEMSMCPRVSYNLACIMSDNQGKRDEEIDAALAELARSGDQARAAAAGGFAEPSKTPLEMPLERKPELNAPSLGWLSVAPLVLGVFSVVLFVLNALGIFGEGPDLDALVEDWSEL